MRAKAAYLLILVGVAVTAYVLGRTSHEPEPARNAPERVAATVPREEAPSPAPAATRPAARPAPAPTPEPPRPKAPPHTLTGVIHVPQGQSALRVRIRISGGDLSMETETDASGGYRFDDVPPGDYDVTASRDDLPARTLRARVGETEGGSLDIGMGGLGGVRAVVVDAFGAPVRDQPVRVRGYSDNALLAQGRTGEDGAFLAEGLAVGKYQVERGPAVLLADVETGETAVVIFRMAAGLTGRVLDASGNPLARAYVRLLPGQFGKEGYRSFQTRTDPQGRYLIEGIPEGEWDVQVQVVGKESFVAPGGKVTVQAGATAEHVVRLEAHSLSGRVTRRDTGAPLNGRDVQITATPVEVQGGAVVRDTGKSLMAFADDDGRFTFTGILPGVYRLWIWPRVPTLRDAHPIVDFSAGGARTGVDVVLETRPVGTLRLKVLDPDGRPSQGLSFSVRQDGSMFVTLHPQQLGDGLYEFVLEAGAREVTAGRKGLTASAYVTIEEGRTVEQEVTLVAYETK